jgi:D-arabinose 1-dehydrogenase-like Zn-dependent alcohol dehydrogenase
MALFGQRKSVSGSMYGSMANLQELLDFAAVKKIRPNVTTVRADKLDEVFAEIAAGNKGGKKYVLDVAGSLQ